jgi:hypothetical protein
LDSGNPVNLFKTHRSGRHPSSLNRIPSEWTRMSFEKGTIEEGGFSPKWIVPNL